MSAGRPPTPLLMGFHCHQPVGNLPSVLRRAFADCYGPLLETLERFPAFAFSLHLSGNLLEWMEEEEHGVFDLVRGLARRGQAELLTGGFYEPILATIPRGDALGQVLMLSRLLERIGGTAPRGLWLTERIWDPSLVGLLSEAGVEYALVDDNHLRSSPFPPDRLGGYFVTEAAGESLALFPISQRLRYLIPFHPVAEVTRALAGLEEGQAGVIFDDGEKFGLWPGTREWVHQKGWLAEFLAEATGSGQLRPMTYSGFLDTRAPLGRAVVPPASYREMEEWSLSPDEASSFRDLVERLEGEGRGEQARRFVRGGTWPNFLLRYPESGDLHRKMLGVSRRIAGWDLPRAKRHLYRGQCNDAYWHGIFGGLYLPLLRNGVIRALNEAEREIDRALGVPPPALEDLDGDRLPEAVVRGGEALFAVSGARGGQVTDLSDKASLHGLFACLARRPELYHRSAPDPLEGPEEGEGGIATIHQAAAALDPVMRREIAYDWYPRHSFIDHFLSPGAELEGFSRCSYPEWGDFVNQPYRLEVTSDGGVEASRAGAIYRPGHPPVPLLVRKRYRLEGRTLLANYRLALPEGALAPGGEGAVFAVEVNLQLPAGKGAEAEVEGRPLDLSTAVEATGARVVLRDPALPNPVVISLGSLPGAVRLWSFPVYTVSRSEKGFDLTYQGSSFSFLLPGATGPGGELAFGLSVSF